LLFSYLVIFFIKLMEKLIAHFNFPKKSDTSNIISQNTSSQLFDLTKKVPNELIAWTFSSIFFISVLIAIWIRKYARIKWYKDKETTN